MVAISSEKNQVGTKKYYPVPPSPQELSTLFFRKDFGHLDGDDRVFCNLPVCDINKELEFRMFTEKDSRHRDSITACGCAAGCTIIGAIAFRAEHIRA